jgi:predicted deacylase
MHRDEVLTFSDKPVSSASGVIRFLRKPGDTVKQGRPVARIYNPFGKLQQTVIAQEDGIVLGHSDSSVAFPGAPVMAFGIGKINNRALQGRGRISEFQVHQKGLSVKSK